MTDKEIPTVPVTTLAGLTSLSDLLSELPISDSLPTQSNLNKSLLFHPRVAEEANNLLTTRDDLLAQQLINAIEQTSSHHIELKPEYLFKQEEITANPPQLLQIIQAFKPNVFDISNLKFVNPNASLYHAQQNISHNYSLHTNQPQSNHYESFNQTNFNNYDPNQLQQNQFALLNVQFQSNIEGQQQQLQQQNQAYQQQNQFLNQTVNTTGINGPSSSTTFPQNNINDLLIAPTGQLQHNLFNNQDQTQQAFNNSHLLDINNIPQNAGFYQNNLQQQQQQQQIVNVSSTNTAAFNIDQLTQGKIEQNQFNSANNLTHENKIVDNQIPQQKNNNHLANQATAPLNSPSSSSHHQQQQPINNNMHLRSLRSNNDVAPLQPQHPKVVPRNNEYLEQQQQQRPSPVQGTTAPEVNHINTTANNKVSSVNSGKSKAINSNNSINSTTTSKTNETAASSSSSSSSNAQQVPLMTTFELPESGTIDCMQGFNLKEISINVSKIKVTAEEQKQVMESLESLNSNNDVDMFSKMIEDEKRMPMKRKLPTNNDIDRELFNKPKLRRVEKKLAPVAPKLSAEELMKTNTYIRFNSFMEQIFEQLDDTEAPINLDDNYENYDCISSSLLANISAEAAKLKARASIDAIPEDKLTLLISYAMRSIYAAKNFSAGPDMQDDSLADECLEKILNAVEGALLICNIYTSKDTKFLQEDNIDAIIKFVQFQLRESLFPSYDPVYTIETKKKTDNKKKKNANYQQKGISTLYTKTVELSKLFVRLFNKFHFVDTIIIHASSLGVEPFFVDNIETLQFVCLDLVTSIFQNEKYKHHRHNILNDILSSVDRLPHSKRNLRPYKLTNNGGNIQMMTALVLQLIQCSVVLPEELHEDNKMSKKKHNSESKPKIEKDNFLLEKYRTALSIGGHFLQTFLSKCKSRASETDFRPLFENFIHDLLTTVNKPEWPAAELLLSLLGTLLVKYMSDKTVEQSIRVVSLEYLGIVAARLRKDTVESRCKVKTMDELIKCIKIEQEKEGDEDTDDKSMFTINPEEERTEFLQRILLDYLTLNSQEENPVWNHARHFYLTQWYRDIMQRKKEIAQGEKGYASRKKTKKRNKKYAKSDSDDSSDSDVQEVREVDQELNLEIFRVLDERKKYLLSKISPFKRSSNVIDLKTYLDYDNANLIAQYLASKRTFSQSFDKYLQKIILVVREPVVAIRTRAMKCLGNIVEVDQSILVRKDMQMGVQQKLLDTAISVREAAVDLVGKYILTDRSLVDQYYDMIAPRILDTGVSVRKRVIKILRDICAEFPEHNRIPDICIKMLRRVNDEENIQKLVMEVFMTMWFTPCNENIKHAISRKVEQIIDVELSSQEKGFHGLLKTVFEPKESKEDSKLKKEIPLTLIRACQQIVNGLVDSIMALEKSNTPRLVGCVTALHSFAQIRPQLLVEHAISLEPWLNIKCNSPDRVKFISMLAEILEHVVPLMEHPGETFLSDLESHLIMLIVSSSQTIVSSCIACLGAIVNKLTKNYRLIRDCFAKFYYRCLVSTKDKLIKDPDTPADQIYKPVFRRGIFTVGLLTRYFDFNLPEINGANSEGDRLPPTICNDVFEILMYFLNCNIKPIRREILQAIGYFCVTNDEYLTKPELKDFYNYLLSHDGDQNDMKITVLKNILLYLMEEENKMTRNDKDWQTQLKTEDLKEMGDISSGMSSRVIQIYLKEILNCFLNADFNVRVMAMRVIDIVLRQGLVHPVQIVPYLICLSTDPETESSHSADKHLQEIDKQYQGFVNMKSQAGIHLSYEMQSVLQQKTNGRVVRGYKLPKEKNEEPPTALNGFLYSLLRNTKPTRRALIQSITKQFDDHRATLSFMLYLADNLAYFPYAVQDEPLYIIHQIDLLISVAGTNLLQTFRDGLKPKPGEENVDMDKPLNPLEDDDDDEDKDLLYQRLPEDTTDLQHCVTSAQGCMLLLILKQHLKEMYGINDGKISRYSPSESTKLYDKAMQRRSNAANFNPKATIALLKDTSKIDGQMGDQEKRVLIDRYLEFKHLMIKLDPEEELDDDDKPLVNNQQTPRPVLANTSSAHQSGTTPTTNANHMYMNNVQNTPNQMKVNLPVQPQVPLPDFEKAISANSISKTPKPQKSKSSPTKRQPQAPTSAKKKKRRKLSSSEDDESDYDDDDDY